MPIFSLIMLLQFIFIGPIVEYTRLIVASDAVIANDPRPFKFVQIADTQLGVGGYEHDKKTFKAAVKQVNELKVDMVFICGDLVGKANDKSFKDFNAIKAGFKMPCHCAAGNHDVNNQPTKKSLEFYRDQIGPDYFEVKHKGYSFVIVNTQLWKAPLHGESEKHDEWVKITLKKAKADNHPVFIVAHYPLFLKNPNEEEKYWNLPKAKRLELLKLFKDHGVVAVIGGHRHKTLINSYKGIKLVNGEVTSKSFDKRPLGFRLWTVNSPSDLKHEFVELDLKEGF